ncbi:hypothetical protein LEP1GSC005_2831 [Leptospira santarosai str. ST188]|uniref:Uncharacterized protein n=1 Tax=Leptospira santarosai serovar Shermani str. LT 821 TaxID=758847 RepID=K8YGP1_9LEPT|nr:hypothetical protein LSS_01547 [Leptospira santarosai serovar Shermani str. LT 821]EMF90566.1 hypothetical protein LEP1GSC005_2831 [Leptospira santarosai str. ST188]
MTTAIRFVSRNPPEFENSGVPSIVNLSRSHRIFKNLKFPRIGNTLRPSNFPFEKIGNRLQSTSCVRIEMGFLKF